jgi:hypothetical protein
MMKAFLLFNKTVTKGVLIEEISIDVCFDASMISLFKLRRKRLELDLIRVVSY